MPLQATSGAASYDAFGGGAAVVPTYIEDVFSTYLRTSNGTTATVVNNLDLSGKGGLVWTKNRGSAQWHVLYDTARGGAYSLTSNNTNEQRTNIAGAVTFNADGYSIVAGFAENNANANTYVDWVLRKQPKFFDIVTYTGDGLSSNVISHNLGSVPGFIICKRTDSTSGWALWHRGNGTTSYGLFGLNSTAAASANFSAAPTSTTFDAYNIWDTGNPANASGGTYVAYLFAHNAGGFGLTGTDNVISCGSYTGNGSSTGPTVTLGYEPQWLLIKNTTSGVATSNWQLYDSMRGLSLSRSDYLLANKTDAENGAIPPDITPTATGFFPSSSNLWVNANTNTYIYIAIRRGPMKVPTTGTSVFGLSARSGTGANATVTGGQTDDAVLIKNRGSAVASLFSSRLTGTGYMVTDTSAAEVDAGATILQYIPWDVMDGVKVGTTSTITNATSNTYINYLFKRAPSFMDVVCFTGTGVAGVTFNHNLGVVPELMIVKKRSASAAWYVYNATVGNTKYLQLNSTGLETTDSTLWNNTSPTASVFSLGTSAAVNDGNDCINYLFATCAGVSKVGTYTGNGTTQTINCGLTAGARFVLLKRTDAAGAWYIYDTARGMTVLTDPYWLTTSAGAEVATLGSVTTVSTGFALDSTILAAINVNAGTYIFLAIA